jgi:predicted DNA-binding transcriptional regulator AlpA
MHTVFSNLITSKEVRAKFGSISESTLERWTKSGAVPLGIKVGRRRLYDVREIDAAIAAKMAERT